jgi:hypothetical protein
VQVIRAVTTAALTATCVAAAAVPANAAGEGAGLGPSTFHLEDLVSGASDDPRVMMLDEQNALVAIDTFAGSASGQIRICKVARVPAASCATPGPILTPGFSGASDLTIRSGLTPGSAYVTNGTANETELYTTVDAGATFTGPVRISTFANAQNFLTLPDGRLLLVGQGNVDPVQMTHVVVVNPDGSSLTTPGFRIPGNYPGAERGVAFNGGRYVVMGGSFVSTASTDTSVSYAVYSGVGDPNVQGNWTVGTLAMDFDDPPNIADGKAGVVLVGVVDGKIQASILGGTAFSTPTTIADSAGTAYLPNVTGDPSGRYTATWQVNNVGLRMSQSLDGVNWTTPITINPDRQFQTDTARTAAGNGLAVTRAGGAYVATRLYGRVVLTLKASPAKVKKGKQSTLTATLVNEGGTGVAGQKITFKKGVKTVGSASTNAAGQATLKVKPTKSSSYTAAYAGTDMLASSTSSAAKVTVSKKQQ